MKVLVGLLAIAALVVGLLYMQGIFDSERVGPGTGVEAAERAEGVTGTTVTETVVPVTNQAVGTVRSRRTTRVSPRIMGTILEVTVSQGDPVEKGQVLARLDDREVKARLAAVRADLAQAEARYDQAAAAWRRYTDLLAKGATTKEQLEGATADYEATKSAVQGAREAVKVAEIVVGYAEIRATSAGVVSERLAEPGDLALPGRPIVLVQDPTDLRLEADVREHLIRYLDVGSPVEVIFGPPLDETIETVIEERAPEADPATRTFRVKATLPPDTGARPGNFGRLRFRTGERKVIRIPSAAVRRIGQLETVEVIEDGLVRVRHVRTIDRGETAEVLSGLSAGERIVVGEGR